MSNIYCGCDYYLHKMYEISYGNDFVTQMNYLASFIFPKIVTILFFIHFVEFFATNVYWIFNFAATH